MPTDTTSAQTSTNPVDHRTKPRRRGEALYTAIFEATLAELSEVDDVYVYGVPAASGVPGEKDVVAAVVPKNLDLAAFDVQRVFRRCRERLEPNFVPSYVQLLQAIPKTASEKPQDRFLIEAFTNDPRAVHTEAR